MGPCGLLGAVANEGNMFRKHVARQKKGQDKKTQVGQENLSGPVAAAYGSNRKVQKRNPP
jgi:hypothetical protein